MVEAPQGPAVGVVAGAALRAKSPLVVVIRPVAIDAAYGRVLVPRRRMTLLARGDRVEPDEGEAREVVVEEHLGPPALLVVALLANLALLASVHVVHLVAPVAVRFQLRIVCGAPVAGVASDVLVLVLQRKVRLVVVIDRTVPVLRSMALLAFFPVAPLVYVVVLMTFVTVRFKILFVHVLLFPVAGAAVRVTVLFLQRKIGVVVVEGGLFPVLRRVALLALLSVPPVVHVVKPVARIAVVGGLLVPLVGVAACAGGVLVLVLQWEVGVVVVEARLPPRTFVVALLAFFPEVPPVRVVLLVTVYAP